MSFVALGPLFICRLAAQAEMEASHKDPVTLPLINTKNWPKNFEAIDKYF